MAYSSPDIIEAIINQGLKKYTKNTITDPDKLRSHLNEIREHGYAYSVEEFSEGVITIAAPIYDYTGKVIAALSVVGPKQRIQQQKIPFFAKKVMSASTEISQNMGYFN